MTSRLRILIWCLVAAAVLLTAALYLFRSRVLDIPRLGVMTQNWEWGAAREVLLDVNRDGVVDFRGRFHGWSTTFYTHQPWAEAWESSQCDGRFDVHEVAGPSGEVTLLEYDSDHDGILETVFRGKEAADFLLAMPRGPDCGQPAAVPDQIDLPPGPEIPLQPSQQGQR